VEEDQPIDELTINMEDFTIQDMIDIEAVAGVDMMKFDSDTDMSLKLIAALIWVSRRATNPAYTFEDAKHEKISVFKGVASDPTTRVQLVERADEAGSAAA
jgi:hypothetical protein